MQDIFHVITTTFNIAFVFFAHNGHFASTGSVVIPNNL